MSHLQNFIQHLQQLSENERSDAIEAKMGDVCAALLDSEVFTRAADQTNASCWSIEEYDIVDIAIDEDLCEIRFSYSASGEEDEDSFFSGNAISGEATAVIDKDGRVTVREVTAEVSDRHEWEEDEEDCEY